MSKTNENALQTLPANLKLPGVEKIDERGLTLRAGLSVEAALATGAFLKTCAATAQLWLADFRRQTIALLGEQDADDVAGQLKLEMDEPPPLPAHEKRERWAALSSEHLFVAGRECEDEAAAERWLDAAVSAGLTAQQLRLSIRAGEIRACSASGAGTPIAFPTLQKVAVEFGLFVRRVDVGEYGLADCELAMKLLGPILEWAGTVRARKAELEA